MKQLLAPGTLSLMLVANMGCSKTATGNAVSDTAASTQRLAQEDSVERNMKALQGKWAVVSMETSGLQMPLDNVKGIVFVFEGNKMLVFNNTGKEQKTTEIKLYPEEDPKRLDMTSDAEVITTTMNTATGQPQKVSKMEKRVQYGIYKLEGDKLTICSNNRKKEYPKTFGAEKASDGSLLVLQRIKP